jgi:AraC-like DNA-binding protein
VRRAINQGLGYRNFSAFPNHYRVEQAKEVLSDPAQTTLPVLTVAMDCGFQSLGPFNRAFKVETGMTPTRFRRRTRCDRRSGMPRASRIGRWRSPKIGM